MITSPTSPHNYPNDLEDRLDFTAIRHTLYSYCANEVSRNLAQRMSYIHDLPTLQRWLAQLQELITIREARGELPSFRYDDLKQYLSHIRPEGATIELEGLSALQQQLKRVQEVRTFFQPNNAEEETEQSTPQHLATPNIQGIVKELESLPDLRRRISNLIDDEGNIKDTASKLLRNIRLELAKLTDSIAYTMNSILRQAQEKGWSDKEAQVTVRDGKLLLPITPAAKREIKGIIHDESATGKTFYLEPEQLVETNNKIREKKAEEKREIQRLLREITSHIRQAITPIQHNCNLLGILDFAHAKLRLAQSQQAVVPQLSGELRMEWFSARHPLLEKHLATQNKRIVPLTLSLNSSQRILLISGPNAGGKSVVLKTVGLLQYMLQCGLAIPLAGHSCCCLFDQIFMDMGDDQSYENDLSTYSSHLLSMKYFCKKANQRTLVLIDEFGSGTEPKMGGAIAEAVLHQLVQNKCMGIINTHYSNLKEYGKNTEGVTNAAMLFDRQKIEPLYKLSVGQPGSSFAVEIARKIGLPANILSYAEDIVGSDYVLQDKYLQDILRDKKYWEEKRQQVRQREKALEQQQQEYTQRLQLLKQERASKIATAEQEALNIIASANAAVEKTIRKIQETKANKAATKSAREKLESKKAKLQNKLSHYQQSQGQQKQEKQEITVGSNVTVNGSLEVGEVLSLERQKAKVRLGSIVMEFPITQLSVSLKKATQIKKSTPKEIDQQRDEKRLNFSPRLDLRGKRVDEAIQSTLYFIDDAVRYNYSPVRILHGTGTGALREAVRDALRNNPAVQDYQDEKADMGGAGITVVHLY